MKVSNLKQKLFQSYFTYSKTTRSYSCIIDFIFMHCTSSYKNAENFNKKHVNVENLNVKT